MDNIDFEEDFYNKIGMTLEEFDNYFKESLKDREEERTNRLIEWGINPDNYKKLGD